MADGRIKRLMVFMPPRHGKSELVSRLFAAYYLYRYPERWVGINSYAADLAYTLSRAARDNFREIGGDIRGDAEAVKHWETTAGGGLWAAGVGGPITGKGWNLGIIDDPLKNAEEASSETIRAKQQEWYGSTFYTREEPCSDEDSSGALVVIQTRWHEADLSGYLLKEEEADDEPEGWHIVSFAAIKEEADVTFPPTCTVEPDGRAIGEALCAERRPVEKLHKIRRRIGDYFFGALYQQQPRPHSGGMFQRPFLPIEDVAPVGGTYVRYWDKASAAPGKGDWTAGVLMQRTPDGRFWIEDVVRGQWPGDERNRIILQTAALDKQKYGPVRIYVEQPPGLAKESTDAVVKMLAGYIVQADPVMKDKTERAEPLASQCRAGNVKMVNGRWNRDFLDEACSFPFGSHDDQVDAASGAFKWLPQVSWAQDPTALLDLQKRLAAL